VVLGYADHKAREARCQSPFLHVPDTHQKSVLAALDKEEQIRVLTCAPENEAATIAGGLYIGASPSCSDPARGLYASVNTLRGVAMDGRIPTFYLIGLLSRERQGALVGA